MTHFIFNCALRYGDAVMNADFTFVQVHMLFVTTILFSFVYNIFEQCDVNEDNGKAKLKAKSFPYTIIFEMMYEKDYVMGIECCRCIFFSNWRFSQYRAVLE